MAVTHLCEAEIQLARDRRDAALALLDQAQAGFESMGMDWHLAQARAPAPRRLAGQESCTVSGTGVGRSVPASSRPLTIPSSTPIPAA